MKITIDDKVSSAIMFSEGGKADARTVKGRANAFFHEELYELFRLISSDRGVDAVQKIKQVNITVPLNGLSGDISAMFIVGVESVFVHDPEHCRDKCLLP